MMKLCGNFRRAPLREELVSIAKLKRAILEEKAVSKHYEPEMRVFAKRFGKGVTLECIGSWATYFPERASGTWPEHGGIIYATVNLNDAKHPYQLKVEITTYDYDRTSTYKEKKHFSKGEFGNFQEAVLEAWKQFHEFPWG